MLKEVLFISSGGPDFASEELWSRTAVDLARQGCLITASVMGWPADHWRTQHLRAEGVRVQVRPTRYQILERVWHRAASKGKTKAVIEIERIVKNNRPQLVVFSEYFAYPPIELLELCVYKKLPFVTIANGNYDEVWPYDPEAERYRDAFKEAVRCYFVSNATLLLTEKHIGCELPNAEVVWSQYNVDYNSSPVWPTLSSDGELRLACVARLDPPTKGQDILLEAIAKPVWAKRAWHLSVYGLGPKLHSLERLTSRLGLSNRVTFEGHVPVEKIWSSNHVLLMPSRHEGMPLAVVEAMLCGRPVLATDVGGNSEIVVDGVTGFLVGAPTVDSLAHGLDRMWANRMNLEIMGRTGAQRIRALVPENPIRVFANKIRGLPH